MPLVEGTLLQMEPPKKDSSMEIESFPVVPELIFPPKIVLGIINLAAGLSPPIGVEIGIFFFFLGDFFYPQTKSRDERMRLRQFGASLTRRRKWKGSCFGGGFPVGGFSIVVWYGLVWWVCWQEKESAINWENDQTAERKILVEIESRLGANADDWDGIKRV